MMRHGTRLAAMLGVAFCIGLLAVDTADAQRRGGGFGSRGARTYSAPPPTRTAPQQAAPIQRSMTQPAPGQPGAQRPANAAAAAPGAAAQAPRRGGFLGGLGGGILGGLLVGGLIGALMGNGFGAGMAGLMAALLQGAILAGVVVLGFKLYQAWRRRQQPAAAGANPFGAPASNVTSFRDAMPLQGGGYSGAAVPRTGQAAYAPAAAPAAQPADQGVEIGVTGADRDTFERLLMEIQDGLGREDYAALRERTTPEVMGFLAENLAQDATSGRRFEISGAKLLEADLSEAWAEGDRDYATCAMRFSAINVLRDRATGAVIEGDPTTPAETTEVWTFMRQSGGPWKLSAIQEV